MKTLRVVTFNIHHGCGADGKTDLKRVAAVLSATGGVLIGLQEVDRYTPRSLFRHQPRWLGNYLQMSWAFGANVSWLPGIQYGNAVMSKGPVLNQINHKLPGGGEQRGLLEVEAQIEGAALSFFCTHLGLDSEDRRMQAERIVEIVSREGRPAILACDLNGTPGSAEYQILTEVFKEAAEAAGGFGTYPSGSPSHQLDFIFLTRHWEVITVSPVLSGASDHLAVVADIKPA